MQSIYFTRRSILRLISICAPYSIYAFTNKKALFGRWSGERPTDGYVWVFRYQLEFSSNGQPGPNYGIPYSYRYAVRQISDQRPNWTMANTGTFLLRRTDSAYWKIIMDFQPDPGSAGPPTEEDREALVDRLGLPEDRTRS